MKPTSLLAASLCLLASAARADWPQFMGSDRSGVSAESVALADSFPGGDPKRVWMVEVGAGLAGPAVSRGKVIVFHRVGDDAVAAALDAATGKAQWEFRYPTDYQDSFGFDPGPRAVPTIGESEVVLWGAEGMVHCLEFETGKLRWKVDAVAEFGSEQGFFGRACPPLIAGGLVIAEVGGPDATVVAFDRQTGAVKWKALRGEAGYAAPVLAKVGGKPAALFFTRAGFAGIDPASGEVLWDVPFRAQMHASVNAAAPAILPGDRAFLSACYQVGGALWQMNAGAAPEKIWQKEDALDCHYATPVFYDGFLYGFHGRQEQGQELRCIDPKNGAVKWSQEMAPGALLVADGKLIIVTEQGELILAAAEPGAYRELARGQILGSEARPPAALSGGKLYARDKRRLVCIELKSEN